MKFFWNIFSAQLALPKGFLGNIFACLMNQRNAIMHRETIKHMAIVNTDHILDIGFGGGASIKQLLAKTRGGKVTGIDLSETMVSRGMSLFKSAISQNKLILKTADVSSMPFDEASFDKACTINTIYFWSDPAAVFSEIYRVLKPSGIFYLTFREKDVMSQMPFTQHGFRLYNIQEVKNFLSAAAFKDISVHLHQESKRPFVCIAARKTI
jgi:ubiquinone/menaquinone biosynthesis C-methylase UbiE